MPIFHDFVQTLPDDPADEAAGLLLSIHWNAGHDVALSSAEVTDGLGYTPVTNARTVSAGAGLSGGGDLSANRTLALDTAYANEWAALQTFSAGAQANQVVLAGGTVTASTPLIDATQTWNNGAVTFIGINFAFTATAAAGASKVFVISETSTYGTIFSIDRYGGFYNYGSFYSSNRFSVGYAAEIVHIKSSIPLGWGTGDPNTGTLDVALYRDAAAVLAQRDGTNAQTSRVYGTYTDSSNYVRASLASSSTAVTLAAETAGTGADNVPVNLTPAGTEGVVIGNFAQLTEMTAPAAGAANTARLFCEDNGAGKTRLMVQFASGAAVQLAIEP